MEPGFTAIANDLFEAVLRYKCPSGHKEVIFCVIRLLDGYHKTERELSLGCLSKFLKQDRSNIAKKMKSLLESNVLKEVSHPNFTEARHIEINRNFREWIPLKKESKTKVKADSTTPKEENTTVVDSTTTPVVESTTIKDISSSLSHRNNIAVVVALKKEKEEKQQQQPNKTKSLSEEEERKCHMVYIFGIIRSMKREIQQRGLGP